MKNLLYFLFLVTSIVIADPQLPATAPICQELQDKILCRKNDAWEANWVDVYENNCSAIVETIRDRKIPDNSVCAGVMRNKQIAYNLNIKQ